uniref:Thioesterase domain-containing protein n=1 Tax=Panagrolaimus superbus TaxID=310955 RepID=A0A914YGI2_9BILA
MDVQKFRENLQKGFSSLPKEGIYTILKRCKIIEANPEKVLYEFSVEEEDLDAEKNLHNGCLATLLDILMASAAYLALTSQQPGVTADLYITYFGTAKMGEKILIECKTIKKGSRLTFLKAKVYKKDGSKMEVIARGTQTMAVSKNTPKSKL